MAITKALFKLKYMPKVNEKMVSLEAAKQFFPFPERWSCAYSLHNMDTMFATGTANNTISDAGFRYYKFRFEHENQTFVTSELHGGDLDKVLKEVCAKWKSAATRNVLDNPQSMEKLEKLRKAKGDATDEQIRAAHAHVLGQIKKPTAVHTVLSLTDTNKKEASENVISRVKGNIHGNKANVTETYVVDGIVPEKASEYYKNAEYGIVNYGAYPYVEFFTEHSENRYCLSDGLTTKTEVMAGLTIFAQCSIKSSSFHPMYRMGTLFDDQIWWTPWFDSVLYPIMYHLYVRFPDTASIHYAKFKDCALYFPYAAASQIAKHCRDAYKIKPIKIVGRRLATASPTPHVDTHSVCMEEYMDVTGFISTSNSAFNNVVVNHFKGKIADGDSIEKSFPLLERWEIVTKKDQAGKLTMSYAFDGVKYDTFEKAYEKAAYENKVHCLAGHMSDLGLTHSEMHAFYFVISATTTTTTTTVTP